MCHQWFLCHSLNMCKARHLPQKHICPSRQGGERSQFFPDKFKWLVLNSSCTENVCRVLLNCSVYMERWECLQRQMEFWTNTFCGELWSLMELRGFEKSQNRSIKTAFDRRCRTCKLPNLWAFLNRCVCLRASALSADWLRLHGPSARAACVLKVYGSLVC